MRPEPAGRVSQAGVFSRAGGNWCGWAGLLLAVIAQARKDAAHGDREAAEWLEGLGIPCREVRR